MRHILPSLLLCPQLVFVWTHSVTHFHYFSLGVFFRGVTIKNQKLKISPGQVPSNKSLPQKQNRNDFELISPILEKISKKIKNSEISNSNIDTSEFSPTKTQETTKDPFPDQNPKINLLILSSGQEKLELPIFQT